MGEEHLERKNTPLKQSAAFAGSTLLASDTHEVLAPLGAAGLQLVGSPPYVAYKHGARAL